MELQHEGNFTVRRSKLQNQSGEGVKRILKNIRNMGRKRLCSKNAQPLFKGEGHYFCHNYTGPGTRYIERIFRGDKPVDAVDAIAKRHDGDYYTAGQLFSMNLIDKNEVNRRIQAADKRMLDSLKKQKQTLGKWSSQWGIGIKHAFEKFASSLLKKPVSFYGGNPEKQTFYMARKGQKLTPEQKKKAIQMAADASGLTAEINQLASDGSEGEESEEIEDETNPPPRSQGESDQGSEEESEEE